MRPLGLFRVWGLEVFQAKRAHGSHGLRMDPSRPPPRCQCYDMCSGPLFSLTTRALHLPGWPGLIKKAWFTCWGSDCPPSPLPVALMLHFLWAQSGPSGVINNRRMEWGKEERLFFFSFGGGGGVAAAIGMFCQFCFVICTMTVPQM